MTESIRQRVVRTVAVHHGIPEAEVSDSMHLAPEKRRQVLDELGGPEFGSSRNLSVGTLVFFMEILEARSQLQISAGMN